MPLSTVKSKKDNSACGKFDIGAYIYFFKNLTIWKKTWQEYFSGNPQLYYVSIRNAGSIPVQYINWKSKKKFKETIPILIRHD